MTDLRHASIILAALVGTSGTIGGGAVGCSSNDVGGVDGSTHDVVHDAAADEGIDVSSGTDATVTPLGTAPACMYQDVLVGPATGGEGTGGTYINVFGKNFGSSLAGISVSVNGTLVTNLIYLGADATGDRQQLGFQVPVGTTGTGQVVVTTHAGSSTCPSTFAVHTGHIWYVGAGIDNVTTGASFSCASLENGTAGDGLGGSGTYASPWTLTNVPSVAINGGSSNSAPPTNARTPQTYYSCISQGDVLVFLDGVNYPYVGNAGLYASLSFDNQFTSPIYTTVMARPGASVQLGGTGYVSTSIRDYADQYMVVSGLTANHSFTFGESAAGPYTRAVNNTILCPDCGGSAGAMAGGQETDTDTGLEVIGNYVTGASCSVAGGISNKQFHSMYFSGNNIDVGWNKIANVCTYNGIQINYGGDDAIGYGGTLIHDNNIEGVNGAGINLSTVDTTQGPVSVYNNIIHHTGIQPASDGGYFFACISFPGEAPSAGASTVNVYNNTMYDCSAYLNTAASNGACAVSMTYETAQTNLTINLKNNIIAAPSYTYAGSENPYFCYAGSATHPAVTGSNNLFYSATAPGSTAPASTLTALPIPTNPLFTSTTTPGSWTNLILQNGSPAIGAGVSFGALTTDFNGVIRGSPPAIGAFE